MNIPTFTADELEFDKVVVFNTAHITDNDDKLLSNSNSSLELIIDQFEYGFRIFVPQYDKDDFDAVIKIVREEGFSEHLCPLLYIALAHEANWIKLDCDGTIYDKLPILECTDR